MIVVDCQLNVHVLLAIIWRWCFHNVPSIVAQGSTPPDGGAMGKGRMTPAGQRQPLEPMSVVRGQVLKNADRIELKIDDVALELLDLNTVPTGAALGRAERTTAAAFDRYVGRTVLLQGRQSGRFF